MLLFLVLGCPCLFFVCFVFVVCFVVCACFAFAWCLFVVDFSRPFACCLVDVCFVLRGAFVVLAVFVVCFVGFVGASLLSIWCLRCARLVLV